MRLLGRVAATLCVSVIPNVASAGFIDVRSTPEQRADAIIGEASKYAVVSSLTVEQLNIAIMIAAFSVAEKKCTLILDREPTAGDQLRVSRQEAAFWPSQLRGATLRSASCCRASFERIAGV